MSKTIKIQILHALAMNSAKNETYQKGVVDKAVDPKLITAAFHEQAGNEQYHEAMLGRYMFSQIELLKTFFADYLTGGGNLAEDATIDSTEADGVTEILLNVSDRFNDGYTKTIARLSQKFVEDRMVYLWWHSVSKEFAAIYLGAAEEDRTAIQNCFHKTAPEAPVYRFPTAIEIRYPIIPDREGYPGYITPDNKAVVPPEILFSNPWIIGRGQESEISYTLSGEDGRKPIDDIIVRADDTYCCLPAIGSNGRWLLRGITPGHTIVTLFSRHDDTVFASFAVRIVP